MATTSYEPAGGLPTPPLGTARNRRLHFILLAQIVNPEDCRRRSKRLIARMIQPSTRSPLGPSGCSRHDDYCWKVTSPSISAVALSIS